MPANPQSPSPQPADGSASGSSRLPFEPKKRRQANSERPTPTAAPTPITAKAAAKSAKPKLEPKLSNQSQSKVESGKSAPRRDSRTQGVGEIPKKVSQRMVSRMVTFCGVPTVLGLLTFPISYLVITQGWFELPNVAVLLLSLGWFGLGVLGLSYGVLSASWDEDQPGTWLGWEEFAINFGRLRASWRKES